jgi:hypothetical protein
MRRLPVLVLLSLALLAPSAHAQSNPFPTPTPSATAAPSTGTTPGDDTSDRTLLLIAGAVLLVFVGIGWYITRDARKNLTAEDRAAIDRGDVGTTLEDDPEGVGTVRGKRKAKRRQTGKRQRQARKANRPRRR